MFFNCPFLNTILTFCELFKWTPLKNIFYLGTSPEREFNSGYLIFKKPAQLGHPHKLPTYVFDLFQKALPQDIPSPPLSHSTTWHLRSPSQP
jgi:hypothetical protein